MGPAAPERTGAPSEERRPARIEPWFASLAYVVLLCLLGPWWAVYEFDPDEGINLMKGALVANGHRLYAEIWSDQPPVFTLTLAALHRRVGFDVAASRALVLAFVVLLVTALFSVVRRSEGRLAAWLAIGVLAASPLFQALSVTVAIGLPAIALMMAALDRAHAGALEGSRRNLWLAGILTALAAHTKLFTLTAVPALLVACWSPRGARGVREGPRRPSRDLLDLLLPAAATFVLLALVAGEAFWDQLIAPHLAARTMFEQRGGAELLTREVWLAAPLATLLGLAGGLVGRPWRRPARWMPLLWFVGATLAMIGHRPYWTHHGLLVIVPLAWMSGGLLAAPVGGSIEPGREARIASWRRLAALVLLVAVGVAVARSGASTAATFRRAPAKEDLAARAALSRFAPISTWVLSDRPIDVYRAQLLVPPPVAVYSHKRRRTGNLSTEQLINVIREYRPEQVQLRRFKANEAFLAYLNGPYVRVGGRSATPHYLARQVAAAAALMSAASDLLARPGGGLGGVHELRSRRRYERASSKAPLSPNEIVVRPPGSAQEVGACLLRFHAREDVPDARHAAIGLAQALVCSQNERGGWDAKAEVPAPCRPGSSPPVVRRRTESRLDDGATQSALMFLLDARSYLRGSEGMSPEWLDVAVRRGLELLRSAQLPEGGWPQRFPPPRQPPYAALSTLNDGATTDSIRVLLRAARELAREPYLATAVRGGEFLLRAQGHEPQPAWAQQYDPTLRPAPARAFEPAAYASLESAYAMDALLELYLETGQERFREPLTRARAWLERSQTGPRRWARLYAPESNRPLFAERDGTVRHELADLSAEQRDSYRWEGGFETFPEIAVLLDRLDALERGGATAVRELAAVATSAYLLPGLATAEVRPARVEVEALVASALREGRWSEAGRLSSRTFAENCATLLDARSRSWQAESLRTPRLESAEAATRRP